MQIVGYWFKLQTGLRSILVSNHWGFLGVFLIFHPVKSINKNGHISAHTPPILNFRVRIRVRFKIRVRVIVGVKDRVTVETVLRFRMQFPL